MTTTTATTTSATALAQWRHFSFFDARPVEAAVSTAGSTSDSGTESGNGNSDSLHLATFVAALDVTCATSGRGHLLLGDALGFVHVVDRALSVASFPAHDRAVTHVHQLRQRNILLTAGYDGGGSATAAGAGDTVNANSNVASATASMEAHATSSGVFPVVKAWNLDLTDRQTKGPLCVRTIKVQYSGRPYPIQCMATTARMDYTALGLANGAVVVIKGDFSRERTTKQRVLVEGDGRAVTGLAWSEQSDDNVSDSAAEDTTTPLLYVTTEHSVCGYRLNTGPNSRDLREFHDDLGCPQRCAILTDRHEMALCRPEAVYVYRADGRGPCFVLGGEKRRAWWYRSYLVVAGADPKRVAAASVSATSAASASAATSSTATSSSADGAPSTPPSSALTIYDLKNKCIAFTADFGSPVQHVVAEWGHLYVLTKNRKVFALTERDTSAKLEVLYKKNLFPLALNMARHQHFDQQTMVDILRRYGDHLYAKGDYDAAMQQYIATIGQLEPSYIIRKFLDAQRLPSLTQYLQALHEKGLATADHTTLLLNCYTKSRDIEKLDEFIKTKDDAQFDVETAIEVCRSSGFHEHATFLAKRYGHDDLYMRIQIEDLRNYQDALDCVEQMDRDEAMRALKKYGRALVSNLPEQATALLFKLCATTNADSSTNPIQEFIHLYMNERRWLRHFLERVVELHASLVTSMVWMTLLELYMVEAKSGDTTSTDEDASADRAMHLLRNPNAAYDPEQALVLAQLHDHAPAILYLLEKLRRYQDLLQFHMDRGDHARVLASAHRFGDHDSTLWLHVLSYFTALPTITPELHAVLAHIEEQDLVPPLRVIQILAKNERVPLSAVREFVVGKVRAQMEEMEADRALMETYVRETEQMRAEIAELQATTKVFQVTKCSSCAAPLELPTVHFLCKHSYHHRCLGENERECPKCAPEHRLVLDIQRSQEVDAKQHDQFFRQLEGAEDGFSVIAEYFGRNTFANQQTQLNR